MKNMVKFILIGGFLLFGALSAAIAETKTEGDYVLHIKATADGSLYKKGDTADFLLSVSKKDGSEVEPLDVDWEISKDSVEPKTFGKSKLSGGKLKVSGKLDEAGFLKCSMTVKLPGGKKVQMLAGAGFAPAEIEPSMPVPSDFKAYWDKQREILSSIPMNAKMSRVDYEDPKIEVFDVQADSFNGLMTGYYARPAGSKPKSCPAVVLPHGAGVCTSWMGNAVNWAKNGFIALDFNAHGIKNGQPQEFYDNLKKGKLNAYPHFGANDRDKTFFRTLYMRLMRAMDFLKSQPEWDGKVLVAYGTSQGGGQAIAAAALDDKVSLTVPFVPAICDHSGITIGRTNGWPHFTKLDKDGKYRKDIVEAVRYIDAMNFAAFIKCPAIFTVGFADPTCQPTSVYAAYSNVKSPKKIYVCEEARHTVPAEHYRKVFDEVVKYVKESKK